VLNGSYYGTFVLTEHPRVDPGRVNIDPINGYLVEFDTYQDTNFFFRTGTTYLPTWVKTPDFGSQMSPAYQFVIDSINEFDRLLNGTGFPNNGYRNLIDMRSFVDYLMVFDVTMNWELQHPKSIFMHKDGGPNARIVMGPIWDFDWAYGFGGGPVCVNGHTSIIRNNSNVKFSRIFQDPMFMLMYRERWNQRYVEFLAISDFIEDMYNMLSVSASLNAIRWYSVRSRNPSQVEWVSYRQEINRLKTWWNNRINWFNNTGINW